MEDLFFKLNFKLLNAKSSERQHCTHFSAFCWFFLRLWPKETCTNVKAESFMVQLRLPSKVIISFLRGLETFLDLVSGSSYSHVFQLSWTNELDTELKMSLTMSSLVSAGHLCGLHSSFDGIGKEFCELGHVMTRHYVIFTTIMSHGDSKLAIHSSCLRTALFYEYRQY